MAQKKKEDLPPVTTQAEAQNVVSAESVQEFNSKEIEPVVKSESKIGAEQEIISAPKKSQEAEDYALGLVQMLDQRRINVDRLQIDVNGKTIFKMRDGDIDQSKTSINNEHAELIKKALSDPASLNGSVKITQGNNVLLHVKDGRVLIDSAGITKQSAKVEVKTPDSPSQGLYERYSQNVKGSGLKATENIATNALKDGISIEQVVGMLKEHDGGYQKIARSSTQEESEQILRKIVDKAQAYMLKEKMLDRQQSQEVKAAKSVSR